MKSVAELYYLYSKEVCSPSVPSDNSLHTTFWVQLLT